MRIAADTHPKESRYLQPVDPQTGQPFKLARAIDTDEGWIEVFEEAECEPTCVCKKRGFTHLAKGPFGGPLVTRKLVDYNVIDKRTGEVVAEVRQRCQKCGATFKVRALLTSTYRGCLC